MKHTQVENPGPSESGGVAQELLASEIKICSKKNIDLAWHKLEK